MPTRGVKKAAVAVALGTLAVVAAACSSNSSSSHDDHRGTGHDHDDRAAHPDHGDPDPAGQPDHRRHRAGRRSSRPAP